MTLKYLLDMYNKIWGEGEIPKTRKHTIITTLLEKEKKYEKQFGFRKQRSTIDTISKITTKSLDGFRRKEKTAVIFFYIKKAYGKQRYCKTLDQL